MSVFVPLQISEGRQLHWVEDFYIFLDPQPTFFGTYKYGYVSNCVKKVSLYFLSLPDFPFLNNELIYVTFECPELGATSKEAQIFFAAMWFFQLVVKHRWYKKNLLIIKMLRRYQWTGLIAKNRSCSHKTV